MVRKLISPWHIWIRTRELEGTLDLGPELGAWCISAQRISKGWGVFNDEDYPFETKTWPPVLVEVDEAKAKQNRIWCYQIVRDASDGCAAIDRTSAFQSAVDITNQWFGADKGIIDYPATGKPAGSHAIAFDDYSGYERMFRFANSWGTEWGDEGYGTLSFDFFDRYMTEGFTGYWSPRPKLSYTHDIQFLQLGYRGFGDTVIHICEAYRHRDDEILGWAFAVQRGGYLEVEELFVKPANRRQGLGAELCRLLWALKQKIGLPLRAWVSHADGDAQYLPAADAVLCKIGLERHPSPVRWASFIATGPDDALPSGTPPTSPPTRPRHFLFTP